MTIPNGSYHYYYPGRLDMPPRLCEVQGQHVYFVDDFQPVRLSKLGGTFIRLVETGLPITLGAVEVTEQEASEGEA